MFRVDSILREDLNLLANGDGYHLAGLQIFDHHFELIGCQFFLLFGENTYVNRFIDAVHGKLERL